MIERIEDEIEITLIGELILKPEIYIDIAIDLMPDDFSVEQCKVIYTACIMLFAKGIQIDAITVLNEIDREREYYKKFIYTATQMVVSTANYKAHINILSQNARRRKAESLCRELLDNLTLQTDIELCRESAGELLKAFDGIGREEAVTARAGYNQLIENLSKQKDYIHTGISELDYFIKVRKGDFVGIGGRPSTGKTALALQIMLHMAKKHKTLFFSLETGQENIFERLLSNYTDVNYAAIQKGKMPQNEIDKIKDICNGYFDELNLSIIEASGYTVEQIRAVSLQKKAEIIFIDYLGLIRATSGKSLYEKVTQISMDLHNMAQRDKITIMALIQLNRATTDEPDMKDLKDSGQLEQDLDSLIMLSTPKNDEENKHIKKLTVAKNKRGNVGIMMLDFAGSVQKFTSIDTNRELPFGKGKVHGEKDEQIDF